VGKTAQAARRARPRGHRLRAIEVEAFGGQLAGQSDGMLVTAGGVVWTATSARCGRSSVRASRPAICLPPAEGPRCAWMMACRKSRSVGLSGGWRRARHRPRGVPPRHAAGCRVEVGPVAAWRSQRRRWAQPGPAIVGVGVGEPGIRQQRPEVSKTLVAGGSRRCRRRGVSSGSAAKASSTASTSWASAGSAVGQLGRVPMAGGDTRHCCGGRGRHGTPRAGGGWARGEVGSWAQAVAATARRCRGAS